MYFSCHCCLSSYFYCVGLVFFLLQWQDVLDIISKALYDNNMTFSQINGINKFQVRKRYFT